MKAHVLLTLVKDVEAGFGRMVEYEALGILLGQQPGHPDVACSRCNEKDAPCQQMQGIMAPIT